MTGMWGGIAVTAFGGLSFVVGLLLWLQRRRLSARTLGVVSALEERGGSGEFPVVTFTPTGVSGGPSGPVQFHSSLSLGGHVVGEPIEIHYEPADPTHASIASTTLMRVVVLTFVGSGLLCVPLGLVLLLVLAPAKEARDEAIERFFAAARAGDAQKLASLTARNAKIDPAVILAEGRRSRSIRLGSSAMDFDDSCVEVILEPNHVRLLTKVVVEKGRWRVKRAAVDDAECEDRID